MVSGERDPRNNPWVVLVALAAGAVFITMQSGWTAVLYPGTCFRCHAPAMIGLNAMNGGQCRVGSAKGFTGASILRKTPTRQLGD